MNVVLPEADPAGLPAPALLLRVLLVATFVLHVIPMNLVLGGGLVAGWAALRGHASARAGRAAEAAGMQVVAGGLAALLPVATAFAITMGIAPLLFLQVLYGQVFYTSSVLMAWVWLALIPLVMLGYYGYHGLYARHGALDRQTVGLGFGSALAFLLVALIFTLNSTLMLRPERFHGLYAASMLGLHVNLDDPTLWPRFLHFVVAALAITGLAVAFLGAARRAHDPLMGVAVREFGVRLFIVATVVQLAVGAWFLLSLPAETRAAFMGARPAHTSLLAASVLMSLLSMVVMPRSLAGGSALIGLTLGGMAAVRHQVRELSLAPSFTTEAIAVRPQWGAFVAFALLLVAGLAVVVWMVSRLVAARAGEEGS